MSQETNNPNTEEKQYTPEEMAQMRKSSKIWLWANKKV